eukprot:scaffold51304_cov59-Attheya_sp.AAC.5
MSAAVHGHFVPIPSFTAIASLLVDLAKEERSFWNVAKAFLFSSSQLVGIGDVLLAAQKTPSGCLTVMGYTDLHPNVQCGGNDNLLALWSAFENLVSGVLLKLANAKLVHSDVRAGWDYTPNIMGKNRGGEQGL